MRVLVGKSSKSVFEVACTESRRPANEDPFRAIRAGNSCLKAVVIIRSLMRPVLLRTSYADGSRRSQALPCTVHRSREPYVP